MAGKKKQSRAHRKTKYSSQKIRTTQNRLRNLEKYYNQLCKLSKRAQEQGKARSFYFHEKYPNFEKYKSTLPQRRGE